MLSDQEYEKWKKQILLILDEDDKDPSQLDIIGACASSLNLDTYDKCQSFRLLKRFIPALEAILDKTWYKYWTDEDGNEDYSKYDDYMLLSIHLCDEGFLEYGTSPRCPWPREPRDSQPFPCVSDESPVIHDHDDMENYLRSICRLSNTALQST